MKAFLGGVFLAVLALAGQQPSRAPSGPEAAIREADGAWAKAIAEKSVEQTVTFYDPEAVTAGSAMFRAQGIPAFRASWEKMFAQPGFALTWTVARVVVTESGTMAYSTGTWKSGTDQGPYLAVWRKQPDGRWKVLIDAAWMIPPSRQ